MKKLFRTIVLIVISLNCGLNYTYSKNYYVKMDGQPTLTGTTWGWASNDLQAVIDKALPGDVVHVAAGTYYGGFVMKEGVSVRGGYTANSSNPDERYEMSESSHYSILDG